MYSGIVSESVLDLFIDVRKQNGYHNGKSKSCDEVYRPEEFHQTEESAAWDLLYIIKKEGA